MHYDILNKKFKSGGEKKEHWLQNSNAEERHHFIKWHVFLFKKRSIFINHINILVIVCLGCTSYVWALNAVKCDLPCSIMMKQKMKQVDRNNTWRFLELWHSLSWCIFNSRGFCMRQHRSNPSPQTAIFHFCSSPGDSKAFLG